MRRRVAIPVVALLAGGISAVSAAAQSDGSSTVHVTVRPQTGSTRTHFAIGFRAAQATGTFSSARRTYRVTASDPAKTGCQSSVTANAPAAKVGASLRVMLSPGSSQTWCYGTFSGAVWYVQTIVCPPGQVCPDLEIAPQKVGTFSFRVTRG